MIKSKRKRKSAFPNLNRFVSKYQIISCVLEKKDTGDKVLQMKVNKSIKENIKNKRIENVQIKKHRTPNTE